MFHVDLTFEDCRIIADSDTGSHYMTKVCDGVSGESREIELTSEQLAMVFALNMDTNGEPKGFENFYEILEPLFKNWPNTLRPIP